MSAAPLGCVALFLRMLEKKARDVAANLCTVCIVKSKYNSDLRLRLKKKKDPQRFTAREIQAN